MISIFDIHNRLELNIENGLFIRNEKESSSFKELYEGDFSRYKKDYKIEYNLKKLMPHSFFLFNNEPLLLFYDYSSASDYKKRKRWLCEKIWNFNKSAIVFINCQNELYVYNGFIFDRISNLLDVLDTIKNTAELTKLKQYSYWKIVTSELWNVRDKDFNIKTRVNTKLLENIKTARSILIDEKSEKPLSQKPLSKKHANRIIGRLIFVRYLLDRKVKLDYKGDGKELLSKDKLPELISKKEALFDFFEYLLEKFKGDILPLNGERDAVEPYHLKTLKKLFAGDNIQSGQRSLFNIFDFDFIPIEFISNIYETFLEEEQKRDKAFYTPPFLVDYVLEQTIKPFVASQDDPEKISCKTVDFTCGSGIFLCETLRTIINRYIEITNPDRSSEEFRKKIKSLLANNIFGNDVNQESVEIAKFSLFITLLDYFEDPKNIEGFEFPDISDNFYNYDVFNETLNDIFGIEKKVEPAFIIGNPPWGKIKNSSYLEYCKKREKKENENEKSKRIRIKISNKEFAQAFLLRLSDFSTKDTVCQVIVTSKLLYNIKSDKFRNYFLNNYLINEVLEISSVRHLIFTNAVGPAAIIKYRYSFGKDTKENLIEYVSLKPNTYFAIFKTILIEKHDYKEILQKELIRNDWLWKTLVYGNILDYRFIERLRDKSKFPVSIGDLIEDKYHYYQDRPLFAGVGVKVKGDKSDAGHLKGLPFIQTNKNEIKRDQDLQRYYIRFIPDSIWKKDKVAEVRNERLFKEPPALLVKIGFNADFKLISSVSYKECVFTNSIYAIKSRLGDSEILENLVGILNSDLMSFYMIMSGSSIGIEREQLINEELFPFPVVKSKKISSKVKNLIELQNEINEKKQIFSGSVDLQGQFNTKEKILDQAIFDLYGLTDTERDLIDYTREVTIPILQGKRKKTLYKNNKLSRIYKKTTDDEVKDYIEIFKNHFSKFHNGGAKGYFNTRLFQSENILAIEFYIDSQKHQDQWSNELDNNKALETLAGLGFQKVSKKLFIQKDIKILKSNSFSIVKVNQYKYWHKAIARLDLIEFMEAMIKSRIGTERIADGKD